MAQEINSLLMLPYARCDIEQISRLIKEDNSFIALLEGDLYKIENYLFPSVLRNYTALLDRNVYTRICSIVRGEEISPTSMGDYRWAAAVMAFCQIVDITFNYGSSLQEYASKNGGFSAVSDFECFYKADNCDTYAWIDFALARSDYLDLSSIKDLAPLDNLPNSKRFEMPIYEYRANYIFALKIAVLSFGSDPPERQMMKLMDWMEKDFILGAAALQFANLFFSPSRLRKMLKKRNLDDIRNVAWDLAMIQNWRRIAIEGVKNSEPVILITRDKVVKYISGRLFASTEEEFKGYIVDQWRSSSRKGEDIYQRYLTLNETIQSQWKQRVLPTDEQLDSMTNELEIEVRNLKR